MFEHLDTDTGGEWVLANIKSALKRVKVSEKQNLRNRMEKSAMKTAIRRFDEALAGDDKEKQQQIHCPYNFPHRAFPQPVSDKVKWIPSGSTPCQYLAVTKCPSG